MEKEAAGAIPRRHAGLKITNCSVLHLRDIDHVAGNGIGIILATVGSWSTPDCVIEIGDGVGCDLTSDGSVVRVEDHAVDVSARIRRGTMVKADL